MKSEKIYILGDSYSTFKGHIPQGFAYWYSEEEKAETDVRAVGETWWSRLLGAAGLTLLKNNSFSGTTICNTGYSGYCPDTSFIGRLDSEIAKGVFSENMPDILLIFGGTNDNWAGSPIGELKYGDWTEGDLKCVLPSFCYLLHRIKSKLASARTVIIINTELKPQITEGFVAACEEYGIEYIRLENISKRAGHPDKLGMEQIFEQVSAGLKKSR